MAASFQKNARENVPPRELSVYFIVTEIQRPWRTKETISLFDCNAAWKWSSYDIGNISLRIAQQLSNLAYFICFRLKCSRFMRIASYRNCSWVVEIDARSEYLSCTIEKKRNTRLITVTSNITVFDFSAPRRAYGNHLPTEIYFRCGQPRTILLCNLRKFLIR